MVPGMKIYRTILWVICIALLLSARPPAEAGSPTTAPVQYHEEARVNPSMHLHVVTVDLTDPRVVLRVVRADDDPDGDGPWQTRLATVRKIAEKTNLLA